MKKTIIILLAVMFMMSSVSLAEDLSSLPDADLLVLYRQVSIELESRGIDPKAVYPEDAFSGDDLWTEEMAERLELFFGFWSASDIQSMLTVCSPGWTADKENPAASLFIALANRTPEDYAILSVSREQDDFVRDVTLAAAIDNNNGRGPTDYILRITMMREQDGLWYIDPDCLETFERTAEWHREEPAPKTAETASEVAGDMVLYYCPDGGQYYHADQNCKIVNEKYLPLKGSFTYGELENEVYNDLQPCKVCGAPLRRENPFLSESFSDAVEAADRFVFVGGDIDYLAAPAEKDGKFIRMVTLLDDHAKELYMAAIGAEDSGEAYEAFQTYAWSLPVTYTEELTVKPKDQAELDTLAGRTVGELLTEGYSFYGIGGGENLPTIADLSYGLFNYEFEVDASFEQYRENEGWDGLEDMKVKSGKLSGFSTLATNLDYLADGTFEPQIVPHITAEEAAAADQVPPPEEYTVKAWPLDTEGYSDLLNNIENRYGQVYMVSGVVHQVLSQSPMRLVINTSADGKSQPVIIEYHGQTSISPDTGSHCRIYADVTSSCYILPVLTARYTFSGLTADPADEPVSDDEDVFTVPNIIPAKGIEDFIGKWNYFRIVNEDGTEMSREEMLAEGLVDDQAEIIITKDEIQLYAASLDGSESVKYEFAPDDGSLRILNGSDDLPVLHLTDNGMLLIFIPAYNSSSGDTIAFLIREEP